MKEGNYLTSVLFLLVEGRTVTYNFLCLRHLNSMNSCLISNDIHLYIKMRKSIEKGDVLQQMTVLQAHVQMKCINSCF